jgi:hypothetical protein
MMGAAYKNWTRGLEWIKVPTPLEVRVEAMDFDELVQDMTAAGESLILNWGEDSSMWECDFIASGTRYSACATTPVEALRGALKKRLEAA